MIRFSITQGDNDPIQTEWEDEPLRTGSVHTAVQRISELRQAYGRSAEISIERTTAIPEPDRTQVRFKIDMGDNKVGYSKPFPIAEKESRLAEMKEKYPKASITEDIARG